MTWIRALASRDKFRFLVAGVSTTAFSYLLYVVFLLAAMAPKPAYALAYALGIAWSYSINSVWVFRQSWSWKGLLSFPLVYLVQAAVSFFIFVALLDKLHVPRLVAPLLTIVLLLPLTYVLSRALIRKTSARTTPPGDQPP